ncbi:hypothetical protein TNCV_820331 [Trichonephila clavipes]|nr:hypothetical protein TNCV_820331 [Trichonephila clavipes]
MYPLAVMVLWINIRGDWVMYVMTPHITQIVEVVCLSTVKAGLRCSPCLHTYMIIITARIESGFEDDLIPFCYSPISFEHDTTSDGGFGELIVTGCAHNGCYYSDCPSARCLAMIQSDTEVCSEGAACVWMTDNETFDVRRM